MVEIILAVAIVILLNNVSVNQLNGTKWHKVWPADLVWWAFHIGVFTGQFLIAWCIAETGLFLCFDWRYETPIILGIMLFQAATMPFAGWLVEYWPEKKVAAVIPHEEVVTAPSGCPADESIFWTKDLGLYILETVQAMDDEAVCNLYYFSKKKMYSLDDNGRDWSYMLHINSIAFVVAMDRKLELTV